MTSRTMQISELVGVLSQYPEATAAAEAARLMTEPTVTVGQQHVEGLVDSLQIKYSRARDKGHSVTGLSRLAISLAELKSELVDCLVVPKGFDYFMVVLNPESLELVGVVHVKPSIDGNFP